MPTSQQPPTGGPADPPTGPPTGEPADPPVGEPAPQHPEGQAAPPPTDTLAAAVLRAARDIARVSTAFDAELLLSTLLGSVYRAADPDREQSHRQFLAVLQAHLDRAGGPVAAVVRQVLTGLLPTTDGDGAPGTPGAPSTASAPSTAGSGGGTARPAWVDQVGRVRVTGGYAYGDRYGDQTTYLATFAYLDPAPGGPEHAVAVLVDHNLGVARDILVATPASAILDRLREAVLTDPAAMTWFSELDPGTVGGAALAYLRATDTAAELPAGAESLADNRMLAHSRLCGLSPRTPGDGDALPDPPESASPSESSGPESPGPGSASPPASAGPGPAAPPAGATLTEEFLASPDALLAGLAELAGAARESLAYCLGLIVDFGVERCGDPLRWSPRSVELFLLDWSHRRAVLDADDGRVLPNALGAWVSWAGRRTDLPIPAITETIAAVHRLRAEFARLCATGERRSPAASAMFQLLADGVDPTDPAALEAWISTHLGGDATPAGEETS